MNGKHLRAVPQRGQAEPAPGVAYVSRRLLDFEHAHRHDRAGPDDRDRRLSSPARSGLSAPPWAPSGVGPLGPCARQRDPIALIGTGYVGLVTAAEFADARGRGVVRRYRQPRRSRGWSATSSRSMSPGSPNASRPTGSGCISQTRSRPHSSTRSLLLVGRRHAADVLRAMPTSRRCARRGERDASLGPATPWS